MPNSEELRDLGKKDPKLDMSNSGKPEPVFFEFGDVYFECNRCGNYERINTGIKDGMQFVLPTSDQHEWRLICGKCENMMRIFFKESDEETKEECREQIKIEEAAAKKKAEEQALEKARKEAENESKEEDKEEGPTEGDIEDTPGTDQSDGEGETAPALVD